ncbi:MAG: DNA mismatch repair protein MutS [Treponema sp.]|nr:DNA mismatch repair protein MutS [Treponema sp.]
MDVLKPSPMIEQYRRIKKQQEGNILFFRLGDFYEMFAEDAIEVSSLLNLTLTSRTGLPMCGVPYHAARSYIARLLKLGKKVAVCEQLTPPGKKGVIQRDVVEIITPGTTVDEDFLEKGSSNYLCCLARAQKDNSLSFSYIDLSTGEFYSTSFSEKDEILCQELERLSIKEMLVQESLLEEEKDVAAAIYERSGLVLNRWADWLFDPVQAKARLEKQFGLANLKSFGLEDDSAEIISAGALLDYIDTTSKSMLLHIRTLKIYHDSEYMGIDEASQRNLELICNQREGGLRFSLLEIMDETKCSMGRRLLKRRILHPLRQLEKIERRLDIAQDLYNNQGRLSSLRDIFGRTSDLERLCSRLAMDKAHGRDLLAVKNAINSFQCVMDLFSDEIKQGRLCFESDENEDNQNFNKLAEIYELLERGICSEPSILLSEGNLIKDGYNDELDTLRSMRDNSRQILEQYLEEEKKLTGINSLKIRYNRLIGYFFEVTKINLEKVPAHFIRRQGIAGGERYSTDRLAALESEINGACEKVIDLEKKLFIEIRDTVKNALVPLTTAAHRLAELDVAQSMAKAASVRGWIRPELNVGGKLEIYDGRHPVVEAHLGHGEFIPNDILLDNSETEISFAMITGPNMAGKSTYLRSAALIAIMAQAGSFVPASTARIGLCDRVYCRVGSSDNLARGESTFLVEMNETAFILNTATDKSLVIMDEVGRGTGTNDGLSIAWAVSEELLNRIKCRTLFATHFHELSLLSHPRFANRSMEVLATEYPAMEQGSERFLSSRREKIIFLRKLKEGPAEESYGIHVAMLAGLSENVLDRARRIMALLKERDADLSKTFSGKDFVNQIDKKVNAGHPLKTQESKLENLIKEIDPEYMTPLEALNIICQWKKMVQAGISMPIETGMNENQVKIKNAILKKKDNTEPSLFD